MSDADIRYLIQEVYKLAKLLEDIRRRLEWLEANANVRIPNEGG